MRMSTRLSFKQALQYARPNQKIVWGTRSNCFHLIEKNDRDWNTPFSYTLDKARVVGEEVIKNCGVRVIH